MGRVDGLIIPRSYNDYFSRSDPQAIRDLVAASTDDALSSTSENPVQNKVVKAALDGKQATLTFDNAPAENSNNPVTSGGVYTAINTYRSGNYYNSTTATNKYCKIATISTNNFSGAHDATMQVRIRLFETTYGVPYTADVTMAIRASGATVIYSKCVCHEIYLGSGSPYFNANILKYTREVSGNVHTLNLYIYFTNNYCRISVEVLSTSQGDVGSNFSRGGGSIPMAISDEMSGLEMEILFSSMLPFAPTTDGTYALQCDVSSGVPSCSWNRLGFSTSSITYITEQTYDPVLEETTNIEAGQYNYYILPSIPSANIPSGYHIEYLCNWLGGTSGNNKIQILVNNILCGEISTYTPDSKFLTSVNKTFKKSDIVLEPVLSYSSTGINIKVKLIPGSSNGRAYLRSLTITAFLVADSNANNRSPETKGGEDNGIEEQPAEELKK